MNQDTDKEMDILLRRHNRRGAQSVSGTAHMDADELSAYAEGALPDSARSRYASHLADCDSCRKIVTELVLSSDTQVKESSVVQTVETPSRSWREWLAALFSPPVLRYAAPAVALIAFAAIVFVIVTRNRDVTSFVARNEPNRQQASDTRTAAPRNEQGEGSTGTVDNNHGNTSSASAANANASSQNSATTPAQTAQREAQPQTNTPTIDGVSTATSNTTGVAANEPQPPPSRIQERGAEAKDAAKPAPQPSDTLAADRAKEKDEFAVQQKRVESSEAATGGAPSASPATNTTRRGRKAEGAGGATFGAAKTETSEGERQRNQALKSTPAPASVAGARRDTAGADDDSVAETRTVAGKRFRQQNGIWVDTAYNSSRSVIRVRRGSEQYRSLAGDEPIIGTVANSFSGDVIVVVKGKAYRITQ